MAIAGLAPPRAVWCEAAPRAAGGRGKREYGIVGMPSDVDARRYYRIAYQRLEDGELMLGKLDRPKGAVYLTGYAVECILKSLLLATTPRSERGEVLRLFRGAGAHDIIWLKSQLAARGVVVPPGVASELAYVATWSVELRYQPGAGDRDEARRFLRASRAVVAWADGRM